MTTSERFGRKPIVESLINTNTEESAGSTYNKESSQGTSSQKIAELHDIAVKE
jgi:hypothetical protein